MELYDEQFEQKKSQIPLGISIALAVLVLLTIVIGLNPTLTSATN